MQYDNLRLGVTGFRLREALKQLPEKKLQEFFSMDMAFVWSSRHHEYKHFKKNLGKNVQNALRSHYANGHGDPCDKWVKYLTAYTF